VSADNWAICPQCVHNARATADAERRRVESSYGKVSIEEFDALRAALKEVDPSDYHTFREDYEWYIEDGILYGHYKGHCKECGLATKYEVVDPIWAPPAE
jgi:hypothetical protein